ncbi:hypothetical protein [Streptomyces sp. 891-h]|uniref:hypothetical protein n=1 Tax=unclassified Streptomyces TaxID=2593676 RepID=UPI001FAAF975|nr:hypothetical protein [Streptomyces sp. 891-h]UNZ15750.1 hypothetical protein HC362_00220 [Streptomyces sp. 891-h]
MQPQVIAGLDESEPSNPATFTAAPMDEDVLREVRKYQIHEISDAADLDDYRAFLRDALKPFGLYSEEFLPGTGAVCYKVTFEDRLVAIHRLTPAEPESALHRIIPGAHDKRILEVNNVAIEQAFRGDLLLGIILRNCAVLSHSKGYDLVAGVIRHEMLPLFADFGTIPVRHEPLHLLGDAGIDDYVTYFRTENQAQVDYAIARGYHYFHRKVTMREIDEDVKRARRHPVGGELALNG